MNGKYIFLAAACLLGTLSSLLSFSVYFLLFLLYMLYLYALRNFSMRSMLLIMVLFMLFLFVSHVFEIKNHTTVSTGNSIILVVMDGEISMDGDRVQSVVTDKKTNEKLLMNYKINSAKEKIEIENLPVQKLLCRVSGELKRPTQANNPNSFRYEEFLNRQQIFWIFLPTENPFKTCMRVKATPLSLIKQLRSTGIKYLNDHFPTDIASLSAALIFGDRGSFLPEILSAYQKIGIIHLLAISGLHVSLLMGLVYYGGIRIGITKEKMTLFLLGFLPIYAILTGSSPSVNRSVMMIFIVLAAGKWRHKLKLQPSDAISLTLMGYLLFSPFSIFEVGFELSFTVSIALVISAPFIMRYYQSRLAQMLVTSFISQLSALPVLLYQFYEISVISVLVNLIFIPLYSFVLLPFVFLLGFWMLLFGVIPAAVLTAFDHLIHFSNQLAIFFASFGFLTIVTGRPTPKVLFLIFSTSILVFVIWEKKIKSRKLFILWLIPLFLLLFLQVVNRHPSLGEVTMIDVGQGDSILIRLPQGKGTYLIDTGGTPKFENEQWKQSIHSFETGKDIVVPFLKGKGITVIDKLILTHGDMDHAGGSFAVMKELKVRQILIPSVTTPNDTLLKIVADAQHLGIPVVRAVDGDNWMSDRASFNIVSPMNNFTGSSNSGCIVIVARMGGLSWLFTGDLDIEGENRIMRSYPQLKVDVLKVGHHGSKFSTSSEFIDQLNPRIALISVGMNNRFGHPNMDVVKSLLKRKITLYRTDNQGAITYRYFKNKGTFETVIP